MGQMIKTKSFELAIYSSKNEGQEKMALILPGRLDTKDYAHMRSHVDYLGSKGYFAFSFDPPGTWESPGDISLYSTQNYLKAINELIEYFGNKPTVAMGHSRGGAMAMLAGILNPHVTHIIAAMAAFAPSLPTKEPDENGIYTSYRDLPPGILNTEEKRRFDLPASYFNDPTDYSGLDTCNKPKLFFYGTEDELITPKEVKEMYELAGEPKKLIALSSGHGYRRNSDLIKEVNEAIGEFLNLL